VAFDVAAEAYDRFMGRFSVQLSGQLIELAEISQGQRVIDVGCGTGALTGVLVEELGADHVAAVDPSEPFVVAVRERYPGVEVELAPAEELPFPDETFDAALAQLVVHFMSDPVGGVREMRRVTRPGGVACACVWDAGGGRAPISTLFETAHELDPDVIGEDDRAGVRQGHLVELFEEAGLEDVREEEHVAELTYASFDDWWEPYVLGVGPAGAYVTGLDDAAREALRERCRDRLPEPPFTVTAYAWAVRGTV